MALFIDQTKKPYQPDPTDPTLNELGMGELIYKQMDKALSPTFQSPSKALTDARDGWKKLAYAIAEGVIIHLKNHLEVKDITTSGEVAPALKDGKTGAADPANHSHSLTLPNATEKLIFTQNNDGTGHVQ